MSINQNFDLFYEVVKIKYLKLIQLKIINIFFVR